MKWPKALRSHERWALEPLLFDEIDFIDDPAFHEPGALRKLFAPDREIPRPSIGWYTRLAHERPNHPQVRNAKLPLLNTRQEQHIFLQFNYARFRAERVRQSINPRRLGVVKSRELLKWHRLALDLREKIAEYNPALVLAMAKRLPAGSVDFPRDDQRGQHGVAPRDRQVQRVQGVKFSTYACRAILKGFSRLGMKTTRRRSLFPVGFEPDLERSNYAAEKAAADEQGCVEQVARIFHENRSGLNDLERDIIEKRFAFDNPDGGKGMTLKEVGKLVGLTKERVPPDPDPRVGQDARYPRRHLPRRTLTGRSLGRSGCDPGANTRHGVNLILTPTLALLFDPRSSPACTTCRGAVNWGFGIRLGRGEMGPIGPISTGMSQRSLIVLGLFVVGLTFGVVVGRWSLPAAASASRGVGEPPVVGGEVRLDDPGDMPGRGNAPSDEKAAEAGDEVPLSREITATTFAVTRVIDGDTFRVWYDGDLTSVRLLDIDAPERGDPRADAATAELRRLVEGRTVRLVFGPGRKRDGFGRLLCRVMVGDLDVGQHLLDAGFVETYEPGPRRNKKP